MAVTPLEVLAKLASAARAITSQKDWIVSLTRDDRGQLAGDLGHMGASQSSVQLRSRPGSVNRSAESVRALRWAVKWPFRERHPEPNSPGFESS